MYAFCRVIGCGKPARAGTSDGLNTRFCRSPAEHLQRQGSAFKRSYTAAELAPHRWSGWKPTRACTGSRTPFSGSRGCRQAGPHVEAFRLRGLDPRERAWKHWARLRKAEVDPRRVVAAWLAVELVIAADPQPVSNSEFKRVQAAKLVHRLASGTHKRWEREQPDLSWSGLRTMTVVEEKHWYPRRRGRVLRYIGEDLEGAMELLVEHHLGGIKVSLDEGNG